MANTITKNQTAKVGEKYSYKYVDIAQIHDYLESINARYIQCINRIENDDYIMTKRCFNDEWEENWLQGCKVVDATLVGNNNPAQQQGSALTYARRYSLLMAFGLATEDDDAQSLSTPKEPTLDDAKKYIINFGKKHPNELLIDVYTSDPEFIEWAYDNRNDDYLKKCIDLLDKEQRQKDTKQETNDDLLELMVKFEKLIIETHTIKEDVYKHYGVSSNMEMTKEQFKDAISNLNKKLKAQMEVK